MEKSVREGLVVVYTHFCTLHCWTFGEEVILKLGMEWDYENDIFVVFVFTVVYSRCYLFYFIVVAFVLFSFIKCELIRQEFVLTKWLLETKNLCTGKKFYVFNSG